MTNSLIAFSRTLWKLNKEKKHQEVLTFFKENKQQFSNSEIAGNEFIVSVLLSALRNTNNLDAGIKFLKIYQIGIGPGTNKMVLSAYGWILYNKFKSETNATDLGVEESDYFGEDETTEQQFQSPHKKTEIIVRIEELLPFILSGLDDYSYTLLINLWSVVIRSEIKRLSTNWQLISDFCQLISPDLLKTDCQSINIVRKGVAREMELASDRENWYAWQSKSLLKLGKFDECFDVTQKALDTLEKFHYSNDLWFARRMALTRKEKGNAKDAIPELLKVCKRKNEWFIQKELAELYLEIGEQGKAFDFAVEALNNFGDLEYKVELIYLMGTLLLSRNEKTIAFQHFSLAKLIREGKGWRIPSKISELLKQSGGKEILSDNLPGLISHLRSYWRSISKHENATKVHQTVAPNKGTIYRILNNNEKGADGFIRFNHQSIYFNIRSNDPVYNYLKVGVVVTFAILPERNNKKERAIELRIAES